MSRTHEEEMRCRKCAYDLRALADHRCPECGTEFDPRDESTYLVRPVSGRLPLIMAIIGGFLVFSPFLWLGLSSRSGQPPSFLAFIVIACVGILMLGIVHSRTSKAARGEYPWVIHRRELTIAYAISFGLYTAAAAFGIFLAARNFLK